MLFVGVYLPSGTTTNLLDVSSKATGLQFGTGEHGYAGLSVFYPCDISEAFWIYTAIGAADVIVSDNSVPVWNGRVEDVAIVDGGLRLGAFGYQRALSDTLYTASFTAAAASAIAASLVADVAATNSTQLSTSTALISSPGTTVTDSYEDARPADILSRLAAAGDTSGNAWEWGVYDNKVLHFRQQGSGGRDWYVDAASLELERSLDKLYNSAYGVYTGQTNTKSRTSVSTDSTSISRYGVTREAAVGGDYNDTTIAAIARDTFIAQNKVATPRAKIKFARVYDAAGAAWPLYYVRAGDTITVRNLPSTAAATVYDIRTFYIVSTSYSADNDTLDIELSSNTPTLDRQISQAGGVTGGTITGGNILTVQPRYSTGTFTPAWTGTGTAGTFAYNIQSGFYTRLGDRVFVNGIMRITAITVAPTGSMTITGLPVTSASTSLTYGGIQFNWISNVDYPAGALGIFGYIDPGGTTATISYSQDNAAGAAYPAANFTNANAYVMFTGQYMV